MLHTAQLNLRLALNIGTCLNPTQSRPEKKDLPQALRARPTRHPDGAQRGAVHRAPAEQTGCSHPKLTHNVHPPDLLVPVTMLSLPILSHGPGCTTARLCECSPHGYVRHLPAEGRLASLPGVPMHMIVWWGTARSQAGHAHSMASCSLQVPPRASWEQLL